MRILDGNLKKTGNRCKRASLEEKQCTILMATMDKIQESIHTFSHSHRMRTSIFSFTQNLLHKTSKSAVTIMLLKKFSFISMGEKSGKSCKSQ